MTSLSRTRILVPPVPADGRLPADEVAARWATNKSGVALWYVTGISRAPLIRVEGEPAQQRYPAWAARRCWC